MIFAQCYPHTQAMNEHFFYENFADTNTCFIQGGANAWEYGNQTTTPVGFASGAAANIQQRAIPLIPGGPTLIGMDGSDNTNGQISTLTSLDVNIGSFPEPILEYDFFSNNTVDACRNKLLVEIFDGSTWTAIDSNQSNNSNWVRRCIDLNTLFPSSSLVKVRFSVIGDNSMGGNTANNDILLDNIIFRSEYCAQVSANSVTVWSPTTVDIGFEDYGYSYGWEVVVEGVNFIPFFQQSNSIDNTNYPYSLGPFGGGIFYQSYSRKDI
jgi:hypothetical protein